MWWDLGAKIRKLREERQLTQADLASSLGVSRLTYMSIESGDKRLAVDEIERISECLGISAQALLFPDIDESSIKNKLGKYRQMCLACIEAGGDARDGKITKTKLAKLLYLSDFAYYKKYSVSMSGLNYRALPRGPVADMFFQLIDEMFESGQILIEAKGAAQMISANETSAMSNLSNQELMIINSVCGKWRLADTQTIVEVTHNQAPWRNTYMGSAIPYRYATEISDDDFGL